MAVDEEKAKENLRKEIVTSPVWQPGGQDFSRVVTAAESIRLQPLRAGFSSSHTGSFLAVFFRSR